MFYDQFEALCEKTGEKPYTLVKQLGVMSTSVIGQWRKGSTPRQPLLQKIADHFGVTIDYLLTGEEKSPTAEAMELSDEALMIAKLIDRLPPESRRLLLVQVQALAQAQSDPAAPAESS